MPSAVTTDTLKITIRDLQSVTYHMEKDCRLSIVQEQLSDGIIQKSESAYASPIVLVKKRNGDTRLCLHCRAVNKKVLRNNYPLPRFQDQTDALGKAVYFCTLDMKSYDIGNSERYTVFSCLLVRY